jgi:nucleoside phosphorylase
MIEFAALLSAVKPKERSDQYRILAALFHLQAHVAPVSAKQVGDLLRLHCGKKMPSNVNASLRAYTGYVEPVATGTLRSWSLTSKGMDRLRTLSGLALATASDSAAFETDIGIICALEHPELAAVVKVLGGPGAWKEVGNARFTHVYRETQFDTKKGRKLKVIATTSTSMGLTAAAIATTQLILQFRPRIVVMVGIAAGTHSGNKQFGDVLVADPSIDYNSGKVVMAGGIRAFLPDPYPIGLNPRLRSVLHTYHGQHPIFEGIRKRWSGSLPNGANHLHVGPLGAADQVIDDATRIEEIQKNWRKLIGVEMETYGVYRSCEEAPEPKPRFVSFKAVCDFAAEKTDSWQDYAAFVAAEFAVEFLKTEWETLWPSS